MAKKTSQVADDVARSTDDAARGAAAEGGSILKSVSVVLIPLAVAADGGLRVVDVIKTEREFADGEVNEQQREVAHTRNAAGMAGGWAGAWAGTELGVMGGGAVGTAIAPGPGTAIGGVVGGIAGGIAGYVGGEAAAAEAAEWAVNRIHAAGTTIADTASSAASGVTRTWNWAWGY